MRRGTPRDPAPPAPPATPLLPPPPGDAAPPLELPPSQARPNAAKSTTERLASLIVTSPGTAPTRGGPVLPFQWVSGGKTSGLTRLLRPPGAAPPAAPGRSVATST